MARWGRARRRPVSTDFFCRRRGAVRLRGPRLIGRYRRVQGGQHRPQRMPLRLSHRLGGHTADHDHPRPDHGRRGWPAAWTPYRGRQPRSGLTSNATTKHTISLDRVSVPIDLRHCGCGSYAWNFMIADRPPAVLPSTPHDATNAITPGSRHVRMASSAGSAAVHRSGLPLPGPASVGPELRVLLVDAHACAVHRAYWLVLDTCVRRREPQLLGELVALFGAEVLRRDGERRDCGKRRDGMARRWEWPTGSAR
jgi:hypothetical protein